MWGSLLIYLAIYAQIIHSKTPTHGCPNDLRRLNSKSLSVTNRFQPGNAGSVAAIFRFLQQSELGNCPTIVYGPHINDTAPVQRWRQTEHFESRCTATVGVDVLRSGGGDDGIFTYFDSNTQFSNMFDEGSDNAAIRTHKRIKLTAKEFLEAVFTRSWNGSSVMVRFGGRIERSPCPRLQRDTAAYVSPEFNNVATSLWISSSGATSSAHFDLFDNLHCVVRGRKRVLLSPPSHTSIAAYAPFPGAHPHARQAQNHFNRSAGSLVASPATAVPPQYHGDDEIVNFDSASTFQVVVAEVKAGEALFIPAGWFHHVTAVEEDRDDIETNVDSCATDISNELQRRQRSTTISLSVTQNVDELMEFNQWILHDKVLSLPKGGHMTMRRLSAALTVYFPVLLKTLWDADHDRTEKYLEGKSRTKALNGEIDDDPVRMWRAERKKCLERTKQKLDASEQPELLFRRCDSSKLPWLSPLESLVRLSYSNDVRRQLGYAPHSNTISTGISHLRCPDEPIAAKDTKWAIRQARAAAKRFNDKFRPALRRLFFQPFMETLLSKLGGLANGLDFVDKCVLL